MHYKQSIIGIQMMQISIAKFILLFAAITLAVPESYAKRVGGGRSAGRQSQMMRQRAAPAPPMQRQQATPAPVPKQAVPPVASQRAMPPPRAPAQPIRSQASSGFGGFFTGALIGMGLGSLISSNNQNQNPANQSSGSSGDWDGASGNDGEQANAMQQSPQQEGNPFGVLLLLGLVALAIRYLVRRNRVRQHAIAHVAVKHVVGRKGNDAVLLGQVLYLEPRHCRRHT
jgi:hypothetical protein